MKFIFTHPIYLSGIRVMGQVRVQRSSDQGQGRRSKKGGNPYCRNVKLRPTITPVLKHISREVCMQHWSLANVISLYVVRPSVCRLSSETFVRPTQAIEIFGNVSMPFGTLAIHDLSVKISRISSRGNPSVGGVEHKRGSRI